METEHTFFFSFISVSVIGINENKTVQYGSEVILTGWSQVLLLRSESGEGVSFVVSGKNLHSKKPAVQSPSSTSLLTISDSSRDPSDSGKGRGWGEEGKAGRVVEVKVLWALQTIRRTLVGFFGFVYFFLQDRMLLLIVLNRQMM